MAVMVWWNGTDGDEMMAWRCDGMMVDGVMLWVSENEVINADDDVIGDGLTYCFECLGKSFVLILRPQRAPSCERGFFLLHCHKQFISIYYQLMWSIQWNVVCAVWNVMCGVLQRSVIDEDSDGHWTVHHHHHHQHYHHHRDGHSLECCDGDVMVNDLAPKDYIWFC